MDERFNRFGFAAVTVPLLAVFMVAVAVAGVVGFVYYITHLPGPDFYQSLQKR